VNLRKLRATCIS